MLYFKHACAWLKQRPLSAFMMLDYATAASKLQPPPQPSQESNEG